MAIDFFARCLQCNQCGQTHDVEVLRRLRILIGVYLDEHKTFKHLFNLWIFERRSMQGSAGATPLGMKIDEYQSAGLFCLIEGGCHDFGKGSRRSPGNTEIDRALHNFRSVAQFNDGLVHPIAKHDARIVLNGELIPG